MKIAFKLFNGTSQIILSPETPRDQLCLNLCIDGRADIKLKPTSNNDTVIEFNESVCKLVEPLILDDKTDENATFIEHAREFLE